MAKILLLSDGQLGRQVAGPGQRLTELARVLGVKHQVTLAAGLKEFNLGGVKIRVPDRDLKKKLDDFDLIIAKPEAVSAFRLPRTRGKLVLDLYCPSFLENLEAGRFQVKEIAILKKIMARADFFICANEYQQDLYLGLLLEAKKTDRSLPLNDLIGLVPTGLDAAPPTHSAKVLKGIVPGIAPADKVIIWWGGIWDWLDPATAIRAVAQLAQTRPDVRLVFFSGNAAKAVSLAKETGTYGRSVLFLDRWVPYEERGNYLLESDIGLITHRATLETRFSWRTRVLDYFWADLPVISSAGDSMAALIDKYQLGKVVPPAAPDRLARAILELLENGNEYRQIKENIKRFKPALYWEKAIEPLERFIAARS
ncbi:MAG TPA: glycosyltransferase [Candidatus Sulfotelmatobacter sp.]|nr:glycosyltransferase [Candidatus Sulfotelmatobacter sp.]